MTQPNPCGCGTPFVPEVRRQKSKRRRVDITVICPVCKRSTPVAANDMDAVYQWNSKHRHQPEAATQHRKATP